MSTDTDDKSLNSDTDDKCLSTLSVCNRIYWTIPNFCNFEKNSWHRSEPFHLLGSNWRLEFRTRQSVNKKELLEIGFEHLSENCALKEQKILYGIAGRTYLFSKVVEVNNMSKYLPLVLTSIFEEQKEYIPDGNLRMFFAIEFPSDESKGGILSGKKIEVGKPLLFLYSFFFLGGGGTCHRYMKFTELLKALATQIRINFSLSMSSYGSLVALNFINISLKNKISVLSFVFRYLNFQSSRYMAIPCREQKSIF